MKAVKIIEEVIFFLVEPWILLVRHKKPLDGPARGLVVALSVIAQAFIFTFLVRAILF